MKKIAALTMVRNDSFFLQKWVDWYGSQFGRENLYVFFDGSDQQIPGFCYGVNCETVDKVGQTVRSSDKGRIRLLSAKAASLFAQGYDLVVGCDADEYLVADPSSGVSLPEFLSQISVRTSVSGLGLDFGQLLGQETDLSLLRPFLAQRSVAQIGTRYTKASVLGRPLEWGSGFHRVEGHNFHIAEGLYLMHFGYSDLRIIESRLSDTDKLRQGWRRHLEKRKRTINFANTLPARDFDSTVAWARKLESFVRPPYAWNKPGLLGMKVMVRLPERFKKVL